MLKDRARALGGDAVSILRHFQSSKTFEGSPDRIFRDTVDVLRLKEEDCCPFYTFSSKGKISRWKTAVCEYSVLGEDLTFSLDDGHRQPSLLDVIDSHFGDSVRARGGNGLLVWRDAEGWSAQVLILETSDCLETREPCQNSN